MLTNPRRFRSWQLVRMRGRGPYTGSAWRIAAHVYRERAINCMDAIGDLQRDMRTLTEEIERLHEDNTALRREIEANVIEGIAAYDLQHHAERMAEAIKECFNRRGVGHADRRGNEYIAEMADALSDYGLAMNIATQRDSLKEHQKEVNPMPDPTPTQPPALVKPCPHCGTGYDVSHRTLGDVVLCPSCDKWFTVLFRPGGVVYTTPAVPSVGN